MCNCGCNTCDIPKSPLMLNESLAPKQILSEGLNYHMDNNKPLTEHVYRAGSENYFNLWAEARSLYSREILEITNPDDLEILTETHLGHFGILENGTKVPLDFPIELNEQMDIYDEIANMEFGMDYDQLGDNEKDWVHNEIDNMSMNEEVNNSYLDNAVYRLKKVYQHLGVEYGKTRRGDKYIQINYIPVSKPQSQQPEWVKVFYDNDEDLKIIKNRLDLPMLDEGTYGEGGEDDRKYALLKVRPENYDRMIDKLQDMNINHTRHSGIEGVIKVYTDRIPDKVLYKLTHDVWVDKFVLKEAKKKAKKNTKKLNKPMRSSSGGKAYKVYVKDPKTGNIKTVRFGSGGLKAKINDPKARQAFAKRHKCSTKKDKTKASYWSCRLPRYAKLLGLKSNFTGFW